MTLRDLAAESALAVIVGLLATYGSGSAYGAVRIWIAGQPQVSYVAGVSYANFSQVSSDMTFIRADGQDFIWSWYSHEPIAVGDEITIFRDTASRAAVAFPKNTSLPSFWSIAARAVFPFWLWLFPLTLGVFLTVSAVRYARALIPWATSPVRLQPSADRRGLHRWNELADAISHTTRRSVVLVLCVVCVVIAGKGLFYVQRFSTVAVGLYFTTFALLVDFRLPDRLASVAVDFGRSLWHSVARILVSLAALAIFTWKAALFLHTDFTKFNTMGDLLWEFVATLLG